MPYRLEPFVNDHIYHVFNKTIDKRRIFEEAKYCQQFLKLFWYYRSTKAKISFSKLKLLPAVALKKLQRDILMKKYFKVEILVYCLMPTHFHFLLQQKQNHGIQAFISDVLNSFTKRYNLENERTGPLFLPKFKAVSIGTDEQLKHVSRYIHLNPYSTEVVSNIEALRRYRWSSYQEYISHTEDRVSDDKAILALFDNNRKRYGHFVESHAEYQRTLEHIKHAEKW